MSNIPYHALGVTYSALHATTSPTTATIDADLKVVSSNGFSCIRTYYPKYVGSIDVMDRVISANLNALLSLYMYKDHLSDWVADNYTYNVKPHLASANLLGVLIGNEDYGPNAAVNAAIDKYLKQVKTDNATTPVSTAQTTEFWLSNSNAQRVGALCDFIAVNIYPAWDWGNPDSKNQPQLNGATLSVADGVASFVEQYGKVAKAFPGKQIVVTETGWPTTYGWVVNVPAPEQFPIGLTNALDYRKKIAAWASTNNVNVHYYSMFDNWYGVNTTSQYNFHFGVVKP